MVYQYIASYLLSSSNYSLTNLNNVYNLLIYIIELVKEENKPLVIQAIKTHCGLTIYAGLRDYIIRKYGIQHELTNLFK